MTNTDSIKTLLGITHLAKIVCLAILILGWALAGSASPTVYPRGTAFPLMMYEVETSKASNVAAYGWNIIQSYDLTNSSYINSYLQVAASNNLNGDVPIPCGGDVSTNFVEWPKAQVQAWIQGSRTNNNIAWWDMPEEMRSWKPTEVQLLKDYRAWVQLYDTNGRRPTYEYTPNARTSSQLGVVSNVDIVAVACYCEVVGQPHAWVRYKVQEAGVHAVSLAHATIGSNYLAGQKTVMPVLYCATNSSGRVATPQQCYHDVWSSIASGAQGICLYSYWHATHDRSILTNNLNQYNLAASQISGSEIGQVILWGTQNTNVTFRVTAGPTNTDSFQPGDGNTWRYPSINLLCKAWSNNVYVVAVNSTSNSVSANITNLPVATSTAVRMFESNSVAVNGRGFADTFPAWGVHVYRIPVLPSITTQPTNRTVTVGSPVTFNVVATGGMPLSYQWRKNGGNITGATNTSYSIASVTTNDAANYTVVVTNTSGSITSSNATLTVNVPPSITTQPVSQTAAVGSPVTFSVIATGTAPLSYQWTKNGGNIAGATNTSYSIAIVTTNDAADYTVVVTNVAGSIASSNATLTVNVPPGITTQPASQAVNIGDPVTFSMTATGTLPLTYQWRKDGGSIAGATNTNYSIASVTTNDIANYTVVVTNVAGSITSSNAALTLSVPPGITTQPSSQTVSVGDRVVLTVTATGTAPLSYQWQMNGVNIAAATLSNYIVSSAGTNDAGGYTVVVTNVKGSVTSSNATLTVNVPSGLVWSENFGNATLAGLTSNGWSFSGQGSEVVAKTVNSPWLGSSRKYYLSVGSNTVSQPFGQKSFGPVTNGQFFARVFTASSYCNAGIKLLDANNNVMFGFYLSGVTSLAVSNINPVFPSTTMTNGGSHNLISPPSPGFTELTVSWTGSNVTWEAVNRDPTNATVVYDSGLQTGTFTSSAVPSQLRLDTGAYDNSARVFGATDIVVTDTTVPPSITTQPSSQTASVGDRVVLTVTATGTAPLSYQWQMNGVNIAAATLSNYIASSAGTNDAGNYTVVVTNVVGSVTSSVAVLTVNVPSGLVWSENFGNATLAGLMSNGWSFSGQGSELVAKTVNSPWLGSSRKYYLSIGSNTVSQPFGQKSFGPVTNGQFFARVFTAASYCNAGIKLLDANNNVMSGFYLSGVTSLAVSNINPVFPSTTMTNGGSHNLISPPSPGFTELTVSWTGSNVTWEAVNRDPTNATVVYDSGLQAGTFTSSAVPSQLRLDTGAHDNSARVFGTTDIVVTDTDGNGLNMLATGTRPVLLSGTGTRPVLVSGINTSGNTFKFQFSGTVGQHYRVEFAPALSAGGAWQVLTDLVSMSASPFTVIDARTNSQGFYRVVLVP